MCNHYYMKIRILYTCATLLLFVQLGHAEDKEQLSYIEAISIFNGMVGYIDVIGGYCSKTFPELDKEMQVGKKKFTILHSRHISQVKKIDHAIMNKIATQEQNWLTKTLVKLLK